MTTLNSSASRRTLAALATIAAAGIVLTACAADTDAGNGGGTADGDTTTVRMGIQPWIGYGPWYIAEEEGYFDELGIDFEPIALDTDADKTSAFVAGQIDVANLATHTAMMMLENDVDLRVVLVQDYATSADAILGGPDIESIADLEGASVAYEQGATSDLLLHTALAEAGLTLDDITPVPMPASEAGVALIGGSVDAAVTYEPYITTAMGEDPGLTTIYDGSDAPGLISDVLGVSTEFIENHPEAVQALVDAWGRAIDFYSSDPAAGQAIIAAAIGQDAEALAPAFAGVEFFAAEMNASEMPTSYLDEAVPLAEEAATEAGILTQPADVDTLFDTSFVTD